MKLQCFRARITPVHTVTAYLKSVELELFKNFGNNCQLDEQKHWIEGPMDVRPEVKRVPRTTGFELISN